jgi:dimethylargininase
MVDPINVNMNEGSRLKSVIVCAPVYEYFKAVDLHAHNISQIADRDRAVEQHDHLCTIMRDSGVQVLCIPELRGHPNSVFTRDTCVCVSLGFVQLRMGLASRQGEEVWMAQFLESRDIPQYGAVQSPGTVEGGDVILAGNVVFVGRSRRSNSEGIEQISRLFTQLGLDVRIVDVPRPRLHIGGMMSMIGPRRVLCCEELFPEGFFKGFEVISVPADTFISGNVICLDENVVIAEKCNIPAIQSLKEHGVQVHDIDLSEFVKGRGGPTCLIMPVERGSH